MTSIKKKGVKPENLSHYFDMHEKWGILHHAVKGEAWCVYVNVCVCVGADSRWGTSCRAE